MLSHRFTKREQVLLVILALLLLVLAYYFLVWETTQETMANAQTRQENAQTDMLVEQTKAIQKASMEKEIQAALAAEAENRSSIPSYNNLQNLMVMLNSILLSSTTYEMSFQDVVVEGSLAQRVLNMSFTAADYSTARWILLQLHDAPYRSSIGPVSMTAASRSNVNDISTNEVSVTLAITYYEYVE